MSPRWTTTLRRVLAACLFVAAPLAIQTWTVLPAHAAACVPNERGNDTETILTFRTVGTCQWVVPTGVTSVRALIVGGGGGGGSDNGGGGGGGGVIHDLNVPVTPGTSMNVVVGAGGAGAVNASSVASNGGNSSFASLVARGGGGGGSIDNTAGADGGSAGGRAANRWGNAEAAILTTSPAQGNNGGGKSAGGFGGGGGGGAGAAGANGGGNKGGNGGAGLTIEIDQNFQELRGFGGGGGGGGDSDTPGNGGAGGGGAGTPRGDSGPPTAGTDGHGGGGGAAGGSVAGGLGARGGSGVVILRFTRTSTTYAVIYQGYSATLTAPTGRTFTDISYASYGTPSGAYGTYVNGSCHESSTRSILLSSVVGQSSVTLNSSNGVFGDPCGGTYKWLAVALTLSAPSATTTTTSAPSTTTSAPATTVAPATTTTAPPALEITVNAPTSSTTAPPTVPRGAIQVPGASIPVVRAPVTSSPMTTVGVAASTSTTSTTIAPTTTIAVEPEPPRAPEVVVGEAAATIGDSTREADIQRSDNQLVVTVGSLQMVLGSLGSDGSQVPLDGDGNIRLRSGDKVRIKLAGFEPGSTMQAWLFSTPVFLGSVEVGSDGSVTGNFTVPEGAPSGAHRVVIEATTGDGEPATLAIGVNLGEWDSGPGVTVWLIVTPIVLAVVGALVLPATRRRRQSSAV